MILCWLDNFIVKELHHIIKECENTEAKTETETWVAETKTETEAI